MNKYIVLAMTIICLCSMKAFANKEHLSLYTDNFSSNEANNFTSYFNLSPVQLSPNTPYQWVRLKDSSSLSAISANESGVTYKVRNADKIRVAIFAPHSSFATTYYLPEMGNFFIMGEYGKGIKQSLYYNSYSDDIILRQGSKFYNMRFSSEHYAYIFYPTSYTSVTSRYGINIYTASANKNFSAITPMMKSAQTDPNENIGVRHTYEVYEAEIPYGTHYIRITLNDVKNFKYKENNTTIANRYFMRIAQADIIGSDLILGDKSPEMSTSSSEQTTSPVTTHDIDLDTTPNTDNKNTVPNTNSFPPKPDFADKTTLQSGNQVSTSAPTENTNKTPDTRYEDDIMQADEDVDYSDTNTSAPPHVKPESNINSSAEHTNKPVASVKEENFLQVFVKSAEENPYIMVGVYICVSVIGVFVLYFCPKK